MMKLTFKEHELIADALKLINEKVACNSKDYNFQNKKELQKSPIYKIKKPLTKLKDYMDEILYKDFPNKATPKIYYGNRNNSHIEILQENFFKEYEVAKNRPFSMLDLIKQHKKENPKELVISKKKSKVTIHNLDFLGVSVKKLNIDKLRPNRAFQNK